MKVLLTKDDILNGLHAQEENLKKEIFLNVRNGQYPEAQEKTARAKVLNMLRHQISDAAGNNRNAAMEPELLRAIAVASFSGDNFFAYDKDAGFSFHSTAEEARKNCEDRFIQYLDGHDEGLGYGNVDTLCWGVALGGVSEDLDLDSGHPWKLNHL